MGLEVTRVFTVGLDGLEDVWNTVEWADRTAHIQNEKNEDVYFQEGVEFPKSWSDRAVNIVASKYFYGNGEEREHSLKQLIMRVTTAIMQGDLGRFKNIKHALRFRDELAYILLHQMASFNSPVWFNMGAEGAKQQASACYINSVDDNMESILDLAKIEGMIFKGGSGAGVNISSLRPEGTPLSGGGTSSGPLSFMRGFDAFAGIIKSGGVTRRAAKMVVMDVWHPDIEKFVESKLVEESKAQALIEKGWDGRIDGEAYGTVAFQNQNHSVRVDDLFMEAVTENKDYQLSWGDEQIIVDARKLWEVICHAAWSCGDPGLQFCDHINHWHMVPFKDTIRASNPCSEFVFLNNTSCNLASLNLTKFVEKDGSINADSIKRVVQLLTLAMDILVTISEYPTEEIGTMTRATRPLGIGITNLGGLLMSLGIPYESEEGQALAASIMALITGSAYHMSSILASHIEPYKHEVRDRTIRILVQHQSALQTIPRLKNNLVVTRLHDEAIKEWDKAIFSARSFGVRNAQTTAIAPTGTISFMMDCDTTGVEPVLGLLTYKKLVGGGVIEMVPACLIRGLRTLGFSADQAAQTLKLILNSGTIIDAGVAEHQWPIFATSLGPDVFVSARGHLDMVAALQPFVSGAISKTINMPATAEVEDVAEIYYTAWKKGIKCVSVYVDGSKMDQPVSTSKEVEDGDAEKPPTQVPIEVKADKVQLVYGAQQCELPTTRQSLTHKFRIGGHKGWLTVGMFEDGRPGEIFIVMSKEGSTIAGLLDAWAIQISLGLQYGVPLTEMIRLHAFARFEPAGFTDDPDIRTATSVTDYVVRWLEKTFVKTIESPSDVEIEMEIAESDFSQVLSLCPNCGSIMQVAGVCHQCSNCGHSSGCG